MSLSGLSGLSGLFNTGAGTVFVYLLQDEFTTNAGAPLTSPRTCEPGPGQLTLSQITGQFSIVGGFLTVASAGTSEPRGKSATFARAGGRTVLCRLGLSTGVISRVGWDDNNPQVETQGFSLTPGGEVSCRINSIGMFVGQQTAIGTYECAFVMRSSGGFYFIKGGAFTNWTLVWVDAATSLSPLSAAVSMGTGSVAGGTFDGLRVVDLSAPWNSDYGIATDRKAGAVVDGTLFNSTPNCLVEWTQTTVPSGDATRLKIRRADSSNYWMAMVLPGGDFTLLEVISDGPVTRGTAAAAVTNGSRIVVTFDGSIIRGYVNNVLKLSYTFGSWQNTTSGSEVYTNGTGGVVSNVVAWPRDIDLPAGV
jgi:hypothetical protein